MGPSRVLERDPCPSGLPALLTGACMTPTPQGLGSLQEWPRGGFPQGLYASYMALSYPLSDMVFLYQGRGYTALKGPACTFVWALLWNDEV